MAGARASSSRTCRSICAGRARTANLESTARCQSRRALARSIVRWRAGAPGHPAGEGARRRDRRPGHHGRYGGTPRIAAVLAGGGRLRSPWRRGQDLRRSPCSRAAAGRRHHHGRSQPSLCMPPRRTLIEARRAGASAASWPFSAWSDGRSVDAIALGGSEVTADIVDATVVPGQGRRQDRAYRSARLERRGAGGGPPFRSDAGQRGLLEQDHPRRPTHCPANTYPLPAGRSATSAR